MMLTNHTDITYEALLEFNKHHQKYRKWFILFYNIGTFIYLLSFAIYLYGYFLSENIAFDWTTVYLCAAILFVDAYYTLFYTVFLKKRIKKNPQINAQITYEFTEDTLIANTVSEKATENIEMKYDIIYRVTESEHFLYIFVHSNAAHIIDKSGFTKGSVDELKTLLKNKLPAQKIRF